MTNKLAWKRFEQSLTTLKHSSLMSYDEYCQMYKTLQQYLKEQVNLNENETAGNKKLDLRPFLYASKDTYKNPFLFTLLKLMLELNRTSDVVKQKQSLFRVYQWYCANQKLLNPEIHAQAEHNEAVRRSTKSPIPSLTYSSSNASLMSSSILTVGSIKHKSSAKDDSPTKHSITKTNKLLTRPSDNINILSPGQTIQQDESPAIEKSKKHSSIRNKENSLKTFPVLNHESEKPHSQKEQALLYVEISNRNICKKIDKSCRNENPLNEAQREEDFNYDVAVPQIVLNSADTEVERHQIASNGFMHERHSASLNPTEGAPSDLNQTNNQLVDMPKPDRDLVEVNMNSYLEFLKSHSKNHHETCVNKSPSKSLKSVVVELNLEKRSMQYNVHFPQEKPQKKKNITSSGPVKPDTIRYQWTEHGFGGKTHLKKMKNFRQPTKEKLFSKKYADPKLIASVMVSNHLGNNPRNFRYFIGDENNVAQWIINHPELYLFHSDNVKHTRHISSSQGYGYVDDLGNWCVDLTAPSESLQPVKNHIPTGYSSVSSVRGDKMKAEEIYENNQEIILNPNFEMRTFGKEMVLLRREGTPDISISNPSDMKYDHVGSRLPEGASAKDTLLPNKKIDINRISRPSSRSSSARSKVGNDSKMSDLFNHFCLDGEYELDEETQIQRQAFAATNIQKIFRGHMVRKYMKELRASQQQRNAKRISAISFAERKYQQHLKRMQDNLSMRESNVKTSEWQKKYKAKTRQQEVERKEKNIILQRQQAKVQAKHMGNLKRTQASGNIHEIFHANIPTKSQKKEAAIKIQKVVRGWLVRRHMKMSKEKALKRSLNYTSFVHNEYLEHCQKILKRHGVERPRVQLQFDQLLEYIEKRNKFEVEYDRIVKRMGVVSFSATKHFFEACGLFPSRQELVSAIEIVLKEKGINDHENHSFTKSEIVDIAFQVYVPKGTGLVDTRKSTWMNPLVNGEEAVKLIGKKGMEETNLEHCLNVVTKLMRERNEMQSKGIVPNLLPDDANREGFVSYVPEATTPRLNKKRISSARKSSKTNKR